MTKFVIYHKVEKEYVETVYSHSLSWDKHRRDAIEVDTADEAIALRAICIARSNKDPQNIVIRKIETTETEFDPNAPLIR